MKNPDEYEILERAHEAAGVHMMQKSPRADELIACLEGEIAKRDTRIVELDDLVLSLQCKAIESDDLRSELAALKAQEPVAYISGCYRDVIDGKSDRPPLGAELAFVNMGWIGQIPLYAAPAAPAADAGLVDMYRHLQTVTPYRFKKIQDASITDGGDVLYFHKDRFDAALLDDMAANCAAPATPAADAGLVEALELAANRLDRLALEQGEFWRGYATAWADEARATANGVKL